MKPIKTEEIKYVHGYSSREAERLNDQAKTLSPFIHKDTFFPSGSIVLEAGCGVGAQTKIIASQNPDSKIVSTDISLPSLQKAKLGIETFELNNVEFVQTNMYALPFEDDTFDYVIVCFVLEHLPNPLEALFELKRVLKSGGLVIGIEGDHRSALLHPDSLYAHAAITCLAELQSQEGGNANIGMELSPLFNKVGLSNIMVNPLVVYTDFTTPDLVDGFVKKTFIAMVESIEAKAIAKGLTNKKLFGQGIADLYKTTELEGVFSYTFFKAFGTKQ